MKKKSFTLQKRVKIKEIFFALAFFVAVIFALHTELLEHNVIKHAQLLMYRIDVYISSFVDDCSNFCERVAFLFSDDVNNVLLNIREENQRLQSEISSLKSLEEENAELRKLLDITENNKRSVVTAKVVTIFANDFSRNCLINAGENKKVSVDDIVFNAEGLVGRIIEVGKNWSKVLLITDSGANIPVKIGEVNAIISGDNSDKLTVAIVHEDVQLEANQPVVTSGYGEVFEEGMKVGTLIKENDKFFVRPFVNFNTLKYLNILRKHAVD